MSIRAALNSTRHGFRCARGTLAVAFAILVIALGAGIVTFSIVDGVAFRPLPYQSPHQLVSIALPGLNAGMSAPMTFPDFSALQERSQAFTGITGSRPAPPIYVGADAGAEVLVVRAVTTNLFDVLGVRPLAGRLFTAEDDRTSSPRAAVISRQVWTRHLGGRVDRIGTTVSLGGEQLHVVGVLPDGVWHPMELNPPAVYVPYLPTTADRVNTRMRAMTVIGRRRPGVSIQQARADVERVVAVPTFVQPLHDHVVGSAKRWLLLGLAAVALVIVIACVNVATLLLSRATTRAREFAVRAAMGEPRGVLVAGTLLEGLMLAFAAGAAAAVISVWGVDAAKSALPAGLLTRVSTIGINTRVLSAGVGVAALCAMAFSAAPAWLAAHVNLAGVLQASGGPIAGGRRINRSLSAFLMTEVAIVCVLLVASALVVRSFIEIVTADLGFDRENVATISFRRPAAATSEDARRIEGTVLRNELIAAAKTVPGVVDAAIAVNGSTPLSGSSARYSLVIPGYGEAVGDEMLETRMVTPQYFGAIGMRLMRGRLFDQRDQAGAPRVMVINDAAARRFFAGRDPVGVTLPYRGATTIVGVTQTVSFDGPEGEQRPEMYLPADQNPMPLPIDFGTLILRTDGRPHDVAGEVREAMRPLVGAEPGQPETVDGFFRRLTAVRRLNASVMAMLGFVGLAIGIAGVYGTLHFFVTTKFREIGVRLALGASRSRIMREVLATASRQVGGGIAVGLATSWAISGAFQAYVFGITPTDSGVYAQVAAALVVVAAAASLLPARRAAGLDPVETLRRE